MKRSGEYGSERWKIVIKRRGKSRSVKRWKGRG